MQSIQAIVDELATRLERPVAVNDYSLDLIAASSQDGPIDSYRVDSIVYRHTPNEVLRLLQQRGLLQRRDPFVIEADALPGMMPRLCVPVTDRSFTAAFIWIVLRPSDSLTTAENQHVKRATLEILNVLNASRQDGNDDLRAEIRRLQSIMDDDEYSAAYSVASLIEDGIIDEGAEASVTVVELEEDGSIPVARTRADVLSEAHNAARTTWGSGTLVAVFDGRLTMVGDAPTAPRRRRQAVADIQRQLRGTGYTIRAAGFSIGTEWTRGFQHMFKEAAFAALVAGRITSLPHLLGYDELGAYIALRHLPRTVEAVKRLSPPAAELLAPGRESLLQTIMAFLSHGGDVQKSCVDLAIHRGTLYYRLERCPEGVKDALSDGNKRTSLHLALMLAQLTGS